MSVLHKYKMRNAKYGTDPKQVYMLGLNGERAIFPFDLLCVAQLPVRRVNFFFNLSKSKCLIMYRDILVGVFECAELDFHVQNDEPVFAVNWLSMQHETRSLILDQFKEQLASYTLDHIINSSESKSV